MKSTSYLEKYLGHLIHAECILCEWWPYQTIEAWNSYLQCNPISVQGNANYVAVGINRFGRVIVRELDSLEETSIFSENVFVLPYSLINERFHDEITNRRQFIQ
jgi:hypothetical protein